MVEKPEWPFMVFAEMVPEAERLNDPHTPADEKERIEFRVEDDIEVVTKFADRNTQKGRHKLDIGQRDRVMGDLRRDARGKPVRGEPRRLHEAHGVPLAKVRKWIEQTLKSPRRGSESFPHDWRTVVYGQMLRREQSRIARQKYKR